jgi:hypothetical protein
MMSTSRAQRITAGLEVSVPPNSTATAYIPFAACARNVMINGQDPMDVTGVEVLSPEGQPCTARLAAGDYQIRIEQKANSTVDERDQRGY